MLSNFEGPYFDELAVGDVFDQAPGLTLTDGRAAVHQSILGSRLRLSLDQALSRRVAGRPLADPGFVWDVAIGQSTLVTRRVVANLFYRGLSFHRLPSLGSTLTTRTEVVGLKQNRSGPTGLAALRVTTRDQDDQLVLDFLRCAMLPLKDPSTQTGHADDLSQLGSETVSTGAAAMVEGWDITAFPESAVPYTAGRSWELEAGDVISSAPELARLTLNLAHVHHDRFRQPSGRLVYGGHTIGIALAQLTRTLPDLVTISGWAGCDHLGPVREGDTVASTITIENVAAMDGGWRALDLRIQVRARGAAETEPAPVLDWRLTALSR
ncbi:MaoC family dehydratase [Arthrobacter sp. 08Y14]|uniref:MaoC family dehydratase n=1 Tax=Arthrobacter sp. 08Y14 TaxID=2058885 RepID=UPI000CE38EE6|nr:MaoC family dehydratase [Arthrobacter sp. 08Y14]